MNQLRALQIYNPFSRRFLLAFALLSVAVASLFWRDAANFCVNHKDFLLTALGKGVVIGTAYGLLALGVAGIYRRLHFISWAHGAFFMLGGWIVALTFERLPHPLLAVPVATIAGIAVAIIFYKLFLHREPKTGQKPVLITLTFGYVLYTLARALTDAKRVTVGQYFDLPDVRIPADSLYTKFISSADFVAFFDLIVISTDRVIVGLIALAGLLTVLLWQRVARRRPLPAVAVFALGSGLATVAGAALVQVSAFSAEITLLATVRSLSIVVLSGLFAPFAAVFGGLLLGVTEGIGVGCLSDPVRASIYMPAYSLLLLVFALAFQPIPRIDSVALPVEAKPTAWRYGFLLFVPLLAVPLLNLNATLFSLWHAAFFWASLAVGWAFLAKHGQQISLMHLTFAGLGAYISGIFAADNVVAGVVLGLLVCGVLAVVIGAATLRRGNPHLLPIVTFVSAETILAAINAETAYTNGSLGLELGSLSLSMTTNFYLMLAVLVVTLLVLGWLSAYQQPLLIFVMTALLAALAGAVYYHGLGEIRPNNLHFEHMGLIVVMAVIAGRDNIYRVAAGAIAITFCLEILPLQLPQLDLIRWRYVILGVLALLSLRFTTPANSRD